MTIDYEAAAQIIEHGLIGGDAEDDAKRVVAAALGDTVLYKRAGCEGGCEGEGFVQVYPEMSDNDS